MTSPNLAFLVQLAQYVKQQQQRQQAQGIVTPKRTRLPLGDEIVFRRWYQSWAQRAGIDPDPDNPLHKYDYRGAYVARQEPQLDPGDNLYHWPSEFKDDDHPNRFVKGVDTKTGKRRGPK